MRSYALLFVGPVFGLVLGVVLGLVLAACSQAPAGSNATAASHLPAPPDLSLLDAPVREQFEHRRATLDRILEQQEATAEQTASAHGELGQLYHAYEHHAEAAVLYRIAAQLDPLEVRWHHLLGVTQKRQGSLEESDAALRAALELRPGDPAIHVYLGENAFDRQQFERAERHFQLAVESDPNCTRAHLGLGRVAGASGSAAAIEHLEEARKGSSSATVLYALAMAYRQNEDLERAREILQSLEPQTIARQPPTIRDPILKAVQELRTDAQHFDHLALRAIARKDYQTAVGHLQRALEIKPDQLESKHNLVLALLALGRRPEAKQHLEEILTLDEDFAPSNITMAKLLQQEGHLNEAIEHLQRALRSQPSSATARQRLRELLAERDGDPTRRKI